METPNYIKALLLPTNGKTASRRVWSIDLEAVWLPFFTATNAMGDTQVSSEALGAPLRLGYDADGSVKFSKTGRPVIKVVKEIGDSVKIVRENFVAGLVAYANGVATESPDAYKAQVELAREAGIPILNKDRHALEQALTAKLEQAFAKTEAKPTVEAKAQEAKPKKARVKPAPEAVKPAPEAERELAAVAA